MALTPFLRLTKPPFDSVPWDAAINGDMDIIDGAMAQYMSIPNFGGVWANTTNYTVGQTLLDPTNSIMYQCLVSHTSAAYPTTFAQDRSAHPTYWSNATNVPSDWAAQAKASADAADISEANAATSATNASSSATASQNSATAANNTYNNFINTYYGPYSTPPTTDPNGGARTLGDLYFDTTYNKMQEWSSTGWKDLGAGAPSNTTVGDTSPSSPVMGSMWWDSIGGQLYIYYTDVNTSQWVVANSQSVGAPLNSPQFTGNPTTVTTHQSVTMTLVYLTLSLCRPQLHRR